MFTIEPNRLSKPSAILLTDIDRGGVAIRLPPAVLLAKTGRAVSMAAWPIRCRC
jgi:hypothetical protein